MPCILPVSDLRNYNEVLQNVTEDSPVFLTKNGRGCYVVIDIKEYERMVANTRSRCPPSYFRQKPSKI